MSRIDDSGPGIGSESRRPGTRPETELRFEDLFHQTFGYRAILDLGGNVLEVNQAAIDRTGAQRERILGFPMWDTPWWKTLGDQGIRLRNAIERAARGETVQEDVSYLAGDGAERLGDCIFSPIRGPDGEIAFVDVEGRDITDERIAAETIRRSELRFQAIFNQTFGAVVLLRPDGTVLDVNAAALGGMGHDRELLLGLPFWKAPSWDKLEAEQDSVRSAVAEAADGSTVRREVAYHGGRGQPRIADLSLKPFHSEDGVVEFVIVEGRDVTERRRANDALRESEERLRTLVENAPEAIVLYDLDREGFDLINANAERMFGRTRDDLRNLRPEDLSPAFQPNGRRSDEAARSHLEAAVAGDTPTFEWTHCNRDGETFPTEIRLVRLPASGRRLIRGSITDIRDRKRAESQRAQLELQLRQSQKMETIGQLAGGIAHDFNNLLLAILGYSELAMEGMEESDPRTQLLGESRKAAERAANLTRKLLAFGRRQIIQPEHLDFNRTIPELNSLLRRLIPENIEIEFRPGDGPAIVHADPGQFEHVIVNLCVNARDAMPDGGRIRIETENVRLDPEFCRLHPPLQPGDHVRVTVEDTGCGMAPEVLHRIYEPFFTTKRVGEGTGLGLAMVYGIVQQHGGLIRAESEPGRGSSFRLYLPAVDVSSPQPKKERQREVRGGTETVLIAEDEPLVRELAVRVLERAGYAVLQARDGHEAVAAFERHGSAISLALLDVVMPRMGGPEVGDAIRKVDPEVRILFTSGYPTAEMHTNFVLEPNLKILPKPYTPDRLLETIRDVLDTPSGG